MSHDVMILTKELESARRSEVRTRLEMKEAGVAQSDAHDRLVARVEEAEANLREALLADSAGRFHVSNGVFSVDIAFARAFVDARGTLGDLVECIETGDFLTVWKDGRWKTWDGLSAQYAANDPDWLVNISLRELGLYGQKFLEGNGDERR